MKFTMSNAPIKGAVLIREGGKFTLVVPNQVKK